MHCSTYYGIDVTNPTEAIIKDGYETSLGAAMTRSALEVRDFIRLRIASFMVISNKKVAYRGFTHQGGE